MKLGKMPLVVLSLERGGYRDGLDIPAAQLENERRQAQLGLARLSAVGRHSFMNSGHDMHIEAPDEVTKAIQEVIAQSHRK